MIASLLAAVPSAPFLFLSPLLEVGWCKVARRELFFSWIAVFVGSTPLPTIALADASWANLSGVFHILRLVLPAGASFVYSRQFLLAFKRYLDLFLLGDRLVEANLRRA